jgi:SAM-dependent methyltransferase
MQPRLYTDITEWYRLVDPPDDHADEAAAFTAAFEKAVTGRPRTLLELGAGAGHNALFLKRRFDCTLTDLSARMLALSRGLNPECEHVEGDMRSLRLGRVFDAVLLHDAVVYMTTEDDLLAAATTAFVHLRDGGAALIAPDHLRETFRESTTLIEGGDGRRALRCLEWTWDPDPEDTTCTVEYAFLLREAGEVTALHDRHVEGLFPEGTWRRVLGRAGFDVEVIDRPIGPGAFDRVFLCRRGGERAERERARTAGTLGNPTDFGYN